MTTGYQIGGVDSDTLFIRKDSFVDNSLWLWGYNNYGQLGDGTTVPKSSPVQTVAGSTNWQYVAAGYFHTAAIKTDGTLWGCGLNDIGELGTGDTTYRSSPIQTIAGSTNWKQVSCGGYETAAIKTDGSLWIWGYNNYGQLGTGDTTNRSSPIQTIAGGTNWQYVTACSYHTVAIKTDGTLWTWGYNSTGQLGTGDTTNRSSPIQTIAGGTNWKQVAGGAYHTAAIKTDGTLWTWGYNIDGELGTGDTTYRSSPVQTIAGGTNWKYVAGGAYHTAAIKTDGTLWTWGRNNYGQLGTGDTTPRSSPIQTIAGGTNWKYVACGQFHTTVIKTDGTLWCCGYNGKGHLGTGDTTPRSSPIQTIAGGNNWKSVAGGGSFGGSFTAALTLAIDY